jgi:hypothetical protein
LEVPGKYELGLNYISRRVEPLSADYWLIGEARKIQQVLERLTSMARLRLPSTWAAGPSRAAFDWEHEQTKAAAPEVTRITSQVETMRARAREFRSKSAKAEDEVDAIGFAEQLPAHFGPLTGDRDARRARVRPDREDGSVGQGSPGLAQHPGAARHRGGVAVSWRSILGVAESGDSVGAVTEMTEVTEPAPGRSCVISVNSVMPLEAFEERAAIMEFDGGLTRRKAEDTTARARGFRNVIDFRERLRKATGREGSADNDRR